MEHEGIENPRHFFDNRKAERKKKELYRGKVKGSEPTGVSFGKSDKRNRFVSIYKDDGKIITVRRLLKRAKVPSTSSVYHAPLIRQVSQRGEVHYV